MNKEIAEEGAWTAEQILECGSRLAERALKIWPGRTQEILTRYLQPPPARVFDVGGGVGAKRVSRKPRRLPCSTEASNTSWCLRSYGAS